MLLSHLRSRPLPSISSISNELILDLFKLKCEHSAVTYKDVYQWIKEIYGEKWPEPESPTWQAIVRCVTRLNARLAKIRKQHTSVKKERLMSEFLQEEFRLPRLGLHKGKVINFSPPRKLRQNDKASIPGQAQDQLEVAKYIELCKEMREKMYAINRNANKRLKRKEAIIQKQGDHIKNQQRALDDCEKKLSGAECKVKKLQGKLDRINHRATYWRKRVKDMTSESFAKRKKLHDEIVSLQEVISSLSLDNAELHDKVESIMMSDSEIATFENGKYNDDVRACVYELLSLNVGVKKVAPIVRCVLKNIAHKSVQRLPSYGLTCQMILESLTVAQAHLGDDLVEGSDFITIQTDGTTKYGEHFATYDFQLDSGTYSLGLRHIFSGSACNTLETLKEILSDIDSVQMARGKEAVSSKIVKKIKNTMSDRHSAEKLFNEMLHDYRKEILPDVIENWQDLSDDERDQMTRMNNFFCGLHFLVGLAECTEETIKIWEASALENAESSQSTASVGGSSGTQRLIRTACKAFHKRGSQQCGSSTLFRSYLRQHGVFKIPLAQFVGNRFNIVFYDGAGIYFLKDHIVKFIKSIHGKQANRLLGSVLKDIENDVFLSGSRALGLVDKVVTGPLWRKLQESGCSVIDMSFTYSKMKEKFDCWSNDSSALIDGSARCLEDVAVHEDEVWTALIQSNTSTDTLTLELLQLLFCTFSVTIQRLLVDHLPGGIYHDVTDETLIAEVASVPKTNVSPERDFAILDRLLREKPNAHTVALEAIIMFSHNKTAVWLEKLENSEREKLFKAARTLSSSFKIKFKARRQEIQDRRRQDLVKRAEANARKALKIVIERKLTKEIEVFGGLWASRLEVENGLRSCNKQKEKRDALKLQINFRHKVLGQTHLNKHLFQFSHNRKQYSITQLTENLLTLIGELEPPTDTCSDLILLTERNPEFLVGRSIRHCFQCDDELVWYNGRILSMDPKTKEYQVEYEGEVDVCSFMLFDDILNGDLELL